MNRMTKSRLFSAVLLLCALSNAQATVEPDSGPSTDCPTISPDGQSVVFVSNAGLTQDLWIVGLDGSNARPFINWGDAQEGCADWSPDGKTIVFSSSRGTGKKNIWAVDATGLNPRQLTMAKVYSNDQPRFSPDGKRIVFVSTRTGKGDLWLMGANGSEPTIIQFLPESAGDPDWSPNGTEIVYGGCAATAGGTLSCSLFIIGAQGMYTPGAVNNQARRITNGQLISALDLQPDWSSQGIVFESTRDRFMGLWVVNPDGSGLFNYTAPDATGDSEPHWDDRGGVIFSRSGIGTDPAMSSLWYKNAVGNERRVTHILGFFANGDANTDGKTDCADLSIVTNSLGSSAGQSTYNSRADLNSDGLIDRKDRVMVTNNLPAGIRCK